MPWDSKYSLCSPLYNRSLFCVANNRDIHIQFSQIDLSNISPSFQIPNISALLHREYTFRPIFVTEIARSFQFSNPLHSHSILDDIFNFHRMWFVLECDGVGGGYSRPFGCCSFSKITIRTKEITIHETAHGCGLDCAAMMHNNSRKKKIYKCY